MNYSVFFSVFSNINQFPVSINLVHDNKVMLANFESQFAPQQGQARKFENLICTAIRPSSENWNSDLHRNKARLKNFECRFAPQ